MTDIVATRTTFDGVTVYFHADGKVSTRSIVLYGRLPVAKIFTVADNICTHTWEEVPGLIKAARAGLFPPKANRGTGRLDPSIIARQRIAIEHDRRVRFSA